MKMSLLIAVTVMPLIALAADSLPKRPDSNHYQAMLSTSPFGLATVVPAATPDFATDLYVASIVCSEDCAVVTLASATDKDFTEVVSSKGPNEHGFVISNVQCSDREGQTK
jgi:hypothetical protein